MEVHRPEVAPDPDGTRGVGADTFGETRPGFRRADIESLVLASMAGAGLGGFLFGWIGAVAFAFCSAAALR